MLIVMLRFFQPGMQYVSDIMRIGSAEYEPATHLKDTVDKSQFRRNRFGGIDPPGTHNGRSLHCWGVVRLARRASSPCVRKRAVLFYQLVC